MCTLKISKSVNLLTEKTGFVEDYRLLLRIANNLGEIISSEKKVTDIFLGGSFAIGTQIWVLQGGQRALLSDIDIYVVLDDYCEILSDKVMSLNGVLISDLFIYGSNVVCSPSAKISIKVCQNSNIKKIKNELQVLFSNALSLDCRYCNVSGFSPRHGVYKHSTLLSKDMSMAYAFYKALKYTDRGVFGNASSLYEIAKLSRSLEGSYIEIGELFGHYIDYYSLEKEAKRVFTLIDQELGLNVDYVNFRNYLVNYVWKSDLLSSTEDSILMRKKANIFVKNLIEKCNCMLKYTSDYQ